MFSPRSLSLPILQAPMAGGINTPALAAGCANAGAAGGFGFAYHTPEKIVADLRATRALTSGPLNANFFLFKPVELPPAATCEDARRALAALPASKDIAPVLPSPPYYPDLISQLQAIWQEKPEILTFHFGLPPTEVIERAHALGIAVGVSATCLSEGKAVEKCGADFVVAQGIEAGGHRGTFDVNSEDEEPGTLYLSKSLSDNLVIPVIAAGGIMTGADIRRALDTGAVAAQMGTVFLTCKESGASPAHKRFLLNEQQRGTALTSAWSGRPARGIRTRFIEEMQGTATLPFPLQNTMTGPMRRAAQARDDGEYQSLWAGMNYAQCRQESVAALMARLGAELSAAQGR